MHAICRSTSVAIAFVAMLAIVASAPRAEACSAPQIDAKVEATLREFFWRVGGSRELVGKSAAVLVFPSVIKAGMGIGGEYGEGALLTPRQNTRVLQHSFSFDWFSARRTSALGHHSLHDARSSLRFQTCGRMEGWRRRVGRPDNRRGGRFD
jgi:hypothetical protein